jgi:DNA (cytosine-5)-methyltransferase 1
VILLGSLFSGIGLFELGILWALAEAGLPARVAWQVEIDPFCRRVLARHYPDTDRSVVDVRAAHPGSLAHVDLVVGGFPCQDVSGAGKGAGLAGERSGLWYDYLRIVEQLRPRLVVVENVASGKRRYLCGVRRGLRDAGYRTTALALGAWEVGAPHRRERIFVVAHRDGDGCEGQRSGGLLDGEREARGDHPDGRGRPMAHAVGDACEQGRSRTGGFGVHDEEQGAAPESGGRLGQAQSGVGRGAHGGAAGVDGDPGRWPAGRGEAQHAWEPARTVEGRQAHRRDRLKALGNAVVPQQAREVGRWMIAQGLFEGRQA